jgi:putative ABC transport system permease protein
MPTVAVENVETLEGIRAHSLGSRTFAMQLLIGFAVVAVLLTLAGVYGVLSLTVAARRRELAIRTAVGADARRIVGLVLRGGLALIGAGIAAGVAVSFALSRVLRAMLFEVGPADPVTLGAAALAFAAVALIACALPAMRAARVDPAEAEANRPRPWRCERRASMRPGVDDSLAAEAETPSVRRRPRS